MLGFGSFSSEIQTICMDSITQMGWGHSQAALPMPHVPSGSHILAVLPSPCPSPSLLVAAVPAGSCSYIIPLFPRWLADNFRLSRYD